MEYTDPLVNPNVTVTGYETMWLTLRAHMETTDYMEFEYYTKDTKHDGKTNHDHNTLP